MELIIQLIAGAVGGNAAGGLLKNLNQGTLINSIAGILGGGVGAQVLGMIPGMEGLAAGAGDGSLNIGSLVGSVAAGGIGGGGALAILGVVKNMMNKG